MRYKTSLFFIQINNIKIIIIAIKVIGNYTHYKWMKLVIISITMFLLISLPITNASAASGRITSIKITQVPIDNETMHVRADVSVEVEFNGSGIYKVVVENENGVELSSSLSYKVGVSRTEGTVLITFDRPRTPGNYTYHILLQAKDNDEVSWSTVAVAILVFEVLPSLTESGSNITNTTASEALSGQNQTQTIITGAYVITKNVTITTTETETKTHNVTHTNTTTPTVAVTKYIERLKIKTVTTENVVTIRETETVTNVETTTVFGIPNKLNGSNIIPVISIAGIFAFLLALLLWRRRGP